jgi:hypothetical protein
MSEGVVAELENKLQPFGTTDVARGNKAIQHLKQAIASGKHWYIALLEAIELWNRAEEICNGRYWRYLIDGEAFDWLLLAERLCSEVDGLLPEEEKANLLFFAEPPIELSKEEFRNLVGATKYKAFLNYFYGITIERILILTVEEEMCKEQNTLLFCQQDHIQQEAYRCIYGADMTTLLRHFRDERNYPHHHFITLAEQREFTYWLFKYRLKQSDKAKVASDTKKAVEYFRHQQRRRLIVKQQFCSPNPKELERQKLSLGDLLEPSEL